MKHKDKSYWLRGSIIGAIIPIVAVFLLILFAFLRKVINSSITDFLHNAVSYLLAPILGWQFWLYEGIFGYQGEFGGILIAPLLVIISWIIIGAIAGLIYGKIKSKK